MEQHSFTFPPPQRIAILAAALADISIRQEVVDLGTAVNVDGHTHPDVVFKAWNLGRTAEGWPTGTFDEFVEDQLSDPSIAEVNRRWLRFHGIEA